MKTLLSIFAFLIIYSSNIYSQNEMWNLPIEQQDTVITYTINESRTMLWLIDGDTVATLDAELIAARKRITNNKKQWVSMLDLVIERDRMLDAVGADLVRIARNTENYTNAQIGILVKDAYKQIRQYKRWNKKGNIQSE